MAASTPDTSTMTTSAASVCPLDCPDACSLEVNLEEGRVIGIGGTRVNPTTDGYICANGVSVVLERHPGRAAMSYWTDAAILGLAGTPSVVFGPGGEGLHGLEEYVRVDEVIACRDVLVEVARVFCAAG
jgi:acetylornithine deacetylase/succinyl-diaminopimelate desuccinylase-like protein